MFLFSNYLIAFLATSTKSAKAFGSFIAISDNIFLFISIPDNFNPFMNLEYDNPLNLVAAFILAIQSLL